jgi:hypothetical protein
VDADRIVRKVPLDFSGQVFEIDLIALSGRGIDVILAMSWIKWHKAVLDISRTSDQDLRPKESCHKAQDNQVLQDPREQRYGRRSNMGE